MFAAAMLYSTPALELSIYSTCKRISQKLMRNVTKFLSLIYVELPNTPVMPTLRCNMEEVLLQGPDGVQDIRIVNSYPSQVMSIFIKIYIINITLNILYIRRLTRRCDITNIQYIHIQLEYLSLKHLVSQCLTSKKVQCFTGLLELSNKVSFCIHLKGFHCFSLPAQI